MYLKEIHKMKHSGQKRYILKRKKNKFKTVFITNNLLKQQFPHQFPNKVPHQTLD